ncbi:MAG: hypothetical protein PHW82_08390 [Bacteroidales bacterium]|nr:hypothetical protein [Bacteroidales bacterium]
MDRILENKIVGISISESSDLKRLGFGHMHLQDTMVEFARHLFALGAQVAYGGDVRYDPEFNFATILFDLVETYNNEYSEKTGKILNFICYPLYETLDPSIRAELKNKVQWIEVKPPVDLIITEPFSDTQSCLTTESYYIWSRCLSAMRFNMNEEVNARIILGGKTANYKGKYPGIVEEAYLALKSGKPTYLLGAYGGASLAIIKALKGEFPEELTEEYQFKNENYKSLYSHYNSKHVDDQINYTTITEFFQSVGVSGLSKLNGLSEENNLILFDTTDISEMIRIVVKGLNKK